MTPDSASKLFAGALILPDRVLENGALLVEGDRIRAVGARADIEPQLPASCERIEIADGYIAPGYIDLHVHGGAGADFMDGTEAAFRAALAAHLRHGTTGILPTTTVGRHERLIEVLELCRKFQRASFPKAIPSSDAAQAAGPRVWGCHFYGPYFAPEARGCHPASALRPPIAAEYEEYLAYADAIRLATVAPELPRAEEFARACVARAVRVNVGHSHATFDQMAAAVGYGARHVDHLFCAMSDKTKLRQKRPYPMQGGVQEATLYFDELTTEVIADGKHLSADLLLLALKLKGPDRLALVTDCNRALDMPDGEYIFGPLDDGEAFLRRDDVGIMPDGAGLASSVMGMDHMVRTFAAMTGRPLWEVIRLATLTPARIAGVERESGSLEVGKYADLLALSPSLFVESVYVGGTRLV